MANVVLLFGHGSFNPQEERAKVSVPAGCKFCLFARHKEQIHDDRMSNLTWYISQYDQDAMASAANLLAREEFKDEMTKTITCAASRPAANRYTTTACSRLTVCSPTCAARKARPVSSS